VRLRHLPVAGSQFGLLLLELLESLLDELLLRQSVLEFEWLFLPRELELLLSLELLDELGMLEESLELDG